MRFNLATGLASLGEGQSAEQEYLEAIRLRPDFAEALFNLGNLYREQQRTDEAIEYYRRSLAANARYAKPGLSLAIVYQERGELAAAVAALRGVLRHNPQHVDALFRLGSLVQQLGNGREAVELYHRVLELKPDHAESLNNLGCTARDDDQADQAVACFRRAVAAKPEFAEAHNNLGSALQAQNKLDEAEASYLEALRIKPDVAEFLTNLGSVRHARRRYAEAVELHERALSLKSDLADAWMNLGCSLQMLTRFDEAEDAHRRSLALAPKNVEAHFNLGSVFQGQSRVSEAVAEYDVVLSLKPQHAEARFNRSLCYLAEGDFVRGWPEYEWRLKCKKYLPRSFAQPLWDGRPIPGQTLLVHAEQGLGDTLQFVRFLPAAIARAGGRVLLEAQKALIPLLTDSGIAREELGPNFGGLIARGEPLGEFDVQLPLMSLAHRLGVDCGALPVATQYLRAQPARVDRWRERLAVYGGVRIGINWQGSADYWFDQFRSIPLREFAPIATLPGVTLISLHKGSGQSQIAEVAAQFPVVDLGETFDAGPGAFLDTAAVMQCVDLVISADTSTVHVAGGLGANIWLPCSAAPEWRWLLDRENSPWYPQMRIFRQRKPAQWGDVFERIAAAVAQQFALR